MADAFICDAIRTPIGRFGGTLAAVRADDLAAIPIKALAERNPRVDWQAVDDVILGCANQAGEDNRNVARMATLLAGLPKEVSGSTVNRLCGSGLDAVGLAARAIRSGDAQLMIAGGVESMSRAPYVMGKAESAFSRTQRIEDTTIGWRFVNPAMKAAFGVDSMPETGENVAQEWGVSREDQDAFALRSQQRAAAAQANGRLATEIVPVTIPQKKGEAIVLAQDEHPRATTLEALAEECDGVPLEIFGGVGHVPSVEAPERLAAALLAMLKVDLGDVGARGVDYATGLETRKQVLGEEHVARASGKATSLDAPFQQMITRLAWGELWSNEDLTRRERSMITTGILAALGREELELHLNTAQRIGLSEAELRQVLMHVAVYAGVPAANHAFSLAKRLGWGEAL